MEGYIRVILPAAGVLVLIFTRRRWLTEWVIPMSFGSWILASLWAVFPVALFFLGFAIEQGKVYSIRGISVVLIVLIVVWGVTGLPMLFFGALNAVKSRKVREEYAQTHGLRYYKHFMINNLIPKSIFGFVSPLLTNLLYISRNAYIAGVLRHKGSRNRNGGLRGSEIIVVEGVSVAGPVAATRLISKAKNGKTGHIDTSEIQKLMDKSIVRVEDAEFRVIVSENIQEMVMHSKETEARLSAAQEMVRSILNLIATQGPNFLEQLSLLCLFNRNIVLELKSFLDNREKLDGWIGCTKKIAGWSPPKDVGCERF